MKNLLCALSALLIVILIASCGDNGVGPEPEPQGFQSYYIGDFKVISPDKAIYSGPRSQAKLADTMKFDNNDGRTFTIIDDSANHEGQFEILFIDSSYVDSVELRFPRAFEYVYDWDVLSNSGLSFSINPDRLLVNVTSMYYNACNTDDVVDNTMQFKMFRADSSLYRTYQLKPEGFDQTIVKVVCEN